MTQNIKQKNLWLIKLSLIGGLLGVLFLVDLDQAQAAPIETASESVSVTASVALSDYFADLLATVSTVTASTTPDRSVVIGIQIRSDDVLVFPNHPLTLEIFQIATGSVVQTVTDVTGTEGRLIHTLDATDWTSGLYRIRVTDLAYSRPIPLTAQPTVYLGGDANRLPSTIAQFTPPATSTTAQPVQYINRVTTLAVSQNHPSQVPQPVEALFHHYPSGHDP